jgi:hypothetical protein
MRAAHAADGARDNLMDLSPEDDMPGQRTEITLRAVVPAEELAKALRGVPMAQEGGDVMQPVPPEPTLNTQADRLFILELQADARELMRCIVEARGTNPGLNAAMGIYKKITDHIEEHKRRVMAHYREQFGRRS